MDLKEQFQPGVPLVVRWDGKLLPNLCGKRNIDRLPVLISKASVDQLIRFRKLLSGICEVMASPRVETPDYPGDCFLTPLRPA